MKDHKVKFISEETIASIALDLRTEALHSTKGKYIIVAKYILKNFVGIFKKNRRILKLKLYEHDDHENRLAFVSFKDFKLHVKKEIWEKALHGEINENFIMAHELGHIILHDYHAQAFLIDPKNQLKSFNKECSAEWQANIFASYFLLPTKDMKINSSPQVLSTIHGIPERYTFDRIIEYREQQKRAGVVECTSNVCPQCGRMSVIREGNDLVCTICPPTYILQNENEF